MVILVLPLGIGTTGPRFALLKSYSRLIAYPRHPEHVYLYDTVNVGSRRRKNRAKSAVLAYIRPILARRYYLSSASLSLYMYLMLGL